MPLISLSAWIKRAKAFLIQIFELILTHPLAYFFVIN